MNWANLAQAMKVSGRQRVQKFSRDTADALSWTCQGLSAVADYLLSTSEEFRHDHVCLGMWQQDDLEHQFGHFRRSVGCNFFITVREVFNSYALDRAKLLLTLDVDVAKLSKDINFSTHSCSLCLKPQSTQEAALIDSI
ncbi:group XV phospholipase A2 [Elysia marginata]|uniref:Group XV phospholipase A2 n=1 Tax=Elysia marginata TaxID=1093978 RepID=A0AAV4GR01_9GAST|nr:group XV phospholipase A2 [Elysia marginata]